MLKDGYFISFEGGEGSGKSTQINYLAECLSQEGFDIVVTREPGGTLGAESIRHVLLNHSIQSYGPWMEIILFTAARIDHMDTLITPALRAGKIVLCDRFIDSTRVYQGIAGNMPHDYISLLEKIAVDDLVPDLTFILDLPVEEGMRRVKARKKPGDTTDHFEDADLIIQENRRQAFLQIARTEPERCHVIDATRATGAITAEIMRICRRKIHQRDVYVQ
ncbi:MAG: dTMP kinase [Candidatus Tokpelaia sp. JSC085]|nr:MAG: dTMP kinase [Candidatus Tokpelaia sp. JSC085]